MRQYNSHTQYFNLLTFVNLKKKKLHDSFFYTMLAINIQIIQESKILFGWKIVPVETYVMIEQFFLDLAEKHMLSNNLALVEKIEVRCGSSKVSVNQNVDLECNLWEIAIEYGKHFVFSITYISNNLPIYQYTNPFDIMFNTQNSLILSMWKLSIKQNKKEQRCKRSFVFVPYLIEKFYIRHHSKEIKKKLMPSTGSKVLSSQPVKNIIYAL